ncbi:MAG TPA: peptidylprolyl isomerase [Thermodesulfovibrionales bacterium]|nr:peptidylprolyl isomerase [Thermodesulfovibrionales bacterium]
MKKALRKSICFVVILSSLFLFACAKKGEQQSAGSGSGYVAKVGSTTLTEEDIKRDLKGLPPQIQAMFEGQAGMEKFVGELVKKEILFLEARKKGLEDNAEYKKKVEDFKKLTLISMLLEKEIEEKTKVSEKDVKEYYDAHKGEFAANSQIRASHILVKTEDEAKKIADQLKKGADFATLAKEKSIDTGSAKNGGDLGFFSRGQMVPEFEKVAVTLKKGEVSAPVKTQYGYHLIKVTDRKEGTPLEFDKVKDLLTQKLTAEKQKAVFDSYIEGLKSSYKVDINKDAIAKLAAEKPQTPASPAPKEKK